MHVVFISNSTGKASSKVRAVLDAYAVRIGEAVWASPITEEALSEVHRALKRGISRHTSVACYRNKGVGALDLVWVVGNRNRYDSYGRFAPETVSRKKEFPMPYRHAAILADVSGMGHDIGKSNNQFQFKIGNGDEHLSAVEVSDGIRHEWVSAWVFKQMLAERDQGLPEAMKKWGSALKAVCSTQWMPLDGPISNARDAATALIATHHHAFGYGDVDKYESRRTLSELIKNNLHVRKLTDNQRDRLAVIDLGGDAAIWSGHGKSILKELERLDGIHDNDPHYWHGVTLIARAAMILADHEVSSVDKHQETARSKPRLYANTIKVGGKRLLNQDLIWHLQRVGETAKRNISMFANSDLPTLLPETVEKIMRRTDDPRFQWQDQACDAMPEGPALVFNVASTGAGKTRSNVKIACALRGNRGIRLSSAFNLRTLTLQTHDAYCEELGLAKDLECACLVGDQVVRELHESGRDALRDDLDEETDQTGSVSDLDAIGLDGLHVPDWLTREVERLATNDPQQAKLLKKMLAAPVLVSTIDFLNAAGDMTMPNADHAHAMLRLAHSDLILDEIDSYDTDSMIAVLRLVHVTAMFGRNVIVSSATLSPTLAEYAQRAFLAGMRVHQAMFGMSGKPRVAVVSDAIEPLVRNLDADDFNAVYQNYLSRMADACPGKTKVFRIADVGDSKCERFHAAILRSAVNLHQSHGWGLDGIRVSVGLVRVANIDTCFDAAEALIKDARVHVVTYHAREPLLRRAFKEQHLDRMLRRKAGNSNLEAAMREHLQKLSASPEQDAIFIVVATPVEEVGRDHDFDWGIIEPSSMHSIIQTAGRVNRHRRAVVQSANIVILNRCHRDIHRKYLPGKALCVFTAPGNEIPLDGGSTSHKSHVMTDLLGVELEKDEPLDIRLMVGQNASPFAKFDEESIGLRLGQVMTKQMERNGDLVWFGKWFGDAYPLRGGPKSETYSVLPDGRRKVKFYKYSAEATGHAQAGKSRTAWVDRESASSQDIDVPERAWLSPTIHEVVAHMQGRLGGRLIEQKDMSFQLEPKVKTILGGVDWRGISYRSSQSGIRGVDTHPSAKIGPCEA